MKNLKEENTSQYLNSYVREGSELGTRVKGSFEFCSAHFQVKVNLS